MRSIKTDPRLQGLFERVVHHAKAFGRTLPEMRFFILDSMEFASLLEKNVYPVSPVNIWEGKNMVSKRHRIENGQESSLYYEVVQTGDPSYAYLNHTNNDMVQASVMAHVVGHCEFSELNVMKDSDKDRTERVIHLVKKVNLGRWQMGDIQYMQYWNACESITPLVSPNSQFNLENSVDAITKISQNVKMKEDKAAKKTFFEPYSSTISALIHENRVENTFKRELQSKIRSQTLSRRGYKLRAPCQDIMAFLKEYAPASQAEKYIMEYMYTVHKTHDFVGRTQIMNEGWAMYWEKKIMTELFKERAVKGIIDYSRIFAGVCYPRPFFQRNPYHLGFHMWNHIEEMLKKGKLSLEFFEETDRRQRDNWDRPTDKDPIQTMTHMVQTMTDYEFLRRYLTPELVHEFHLNRIDKRMVRDLGIKPSDIIEENERYIWLNPDMVKQQMLHFFIHMYRPRIYIIDTDFHDGGLLLFHRNDGRKLRKGWIEPTLKNINLIWKAPVFILSQGTLSQYASGRFKESEVGDLAFDQVVERMKNHEKPLKV